MRRILIGLIATLFGAAAIAQTQTLPQQTIPPRPSSTLPKAVPAPPPTRLGTGTTTPLKGDLQQQKKTGGDGSRMKYTAPSAKKMNVDLEFDTYEKGSKTERSKKVTPGGGIQTTVPSMPESPKITPGGGIQTTVPSTPQTPTITPGGIQTTVPSMPESPKITPGGGIQTTVPSTPQTPTITPGGGIQTTVPSMQKNESKNSDAASSGTGKQKDKPQ